MIAGVVAFFGLGLPLIASAVEPSGDQVTAGTKIVLPGGRARFAPVAGWTRTGADASPGVVQLVRGSVRLTMSAADASMSEPDAVDVLKKIIREKLSGAQFQPNGTLLTTAGPAGVASWFFTPEHEGFVGAVASGRTLVLVACTSLKGDLSSVLSEVNTMVGSIEFVG